MANERTQGSGPLAGLRLIEMGTLLAGPFCGQLLGDFGAEVIKIEPPGQGDPMREWGREKAHGMSLWWPVVARNKKSVTLNLREAEGQAIARDLIAKADFLLENFRPGHPGALEPLLRRTAEDQSAPDHDPGLRLRADRSLRQAGRIRRRWRGHGRPPLRLRRSGNAAEPHGHQHRRLAGCHFRLRRRAVGAVLPRAHRARARSSTRPSTKPC